MSSPAYKVGFIGLSNSGWADLILAPTLAQNPSYEIVAVSTTNYESAVAAAKKYSSVFRRRIVKAYYGLTPEDITDDPEVNLVVVSVKTPLHKGVTIPVLAARKDIFIEWPAGRDAKETEEFANLAKQAGVRSIIGLQARYSNFVKKVRFIVYLRLGWCI
jgi:predicted dehydrogenase